MFVRIIIIDKTKIQYTANSVEPIYYTILYYTIPIIILYFAAWSLIPGKGIDGINKQNKKLNQPTKVC